MMANVTLFVTASELVGRHLSERDFRAHFGGPSAAIQKLWEMNLEKNDVPHLWGIDNLLMCLYFLQNPGTSWSVSSARWGVHPNTFKQHLIQSLTLIITTLPDVIFFILIFYDQ